jgi:hypothetical protein
MKKAKVTEKTLGNVGTATVEKEKKDKSMELINLMDNIHELRITGQDGKIAAEIHFERFVKGWNKEDKKADATFLKVNILKPLSQEKKEDEIEYIEVKRFIVGHSEDSNLLWLGDAKLEAEEKREVETV